MNNVNMAGMNAMGGPVGGGMPGMNNTGNPGARQPMPANDNRSQLNTYIYEYFLKNEMYDCARMLKSSGQPINLFKDNPEKGGDGADDGGEGDSKDDINSNRPNDLPAPNLPKDTPESCFLYEWWCLFWDMFNAQRGKGEGRNVLQYVTHTQAQSRMRQDQQQAMLRGLRGGNAGDMSYNLMMRGQPNGMNNELRQKAIQNNRNAPNMQMLAQQKQQQMQRGPSNQENQQRPQSPGSAENAPSPSKRPRLDESSFNPQQMPNGRGQSQGMPQQVGDNGPSNAIQAAHMQLTNGIEPNSLTAQQFPNMPGGGNANAQARTLAGYQANLAQHQQQQMPGAKGGMPNPGGPQSQGSPMLGQGLDAPRIADYYNPGDPTNIPRAGGPAGQPGQTGGNHALQDYQMQLMLLEQQNKKRLMMARQEQGDTSMTVTRPDGSQGPGGPQMGPNGQPYQGTSPQGARSVNSPNPGDQMKRGTPHMGPAGMPSPLPEGQSRGSPSSVNFNMPGGPMDPNMNAPYFKQMNGMDPSMVAGMTNGMRPPSSHPGGFPQQMNAQQAAMVRQQAQAQQGQSWPPGPNGQMMQQPNQGAPQQGMGTPQQRAMPPPSAPTTGVAANGRTQTSSPQQATAAPPTPQQGNKANPKKKAESKDSKAKRAGKKGSAANLNAGATPSAEADTTGATPAAPATPITPVHPKFNGQNGAAQPAANGQPPAQPANNVVPQPADMFQGGFGGMDNFGFDSNMNDLTFSANPNSTDVLQDFDFDSFLHQDGESGENFNFDATAFLDDGIGAD